MGACLPPWPTPTCKVPRPHLCVEAAPVLRAALQQHVARLEVGVHDALAVQVRHGARNVQGRVQDRDQVQLLAGRA